MGFSTWVSVATPSAPMTAPVAKSASAEKHMAVRLPLWMGIRLAVLVGPEVRGDGRGVLLPRSAERLRQNAELVPLPA